MGEPELILASTSPARRALLDALGLPYRAVAPDYDERAQTAPSPDELAEKLALGKARAVAARFPGARVIGADQVVALFGVEYGKPETEALARLQLERLRGRTHQLVTAVALVTPHAERVEHERVELTMYRLSDAELSAYLATREWEGCAGSYRIEARGLGLFSEVRGDLNAVRGLPMTRLVRMLREDGVRFFA